MRRSLIALVVLASCSAPAQTACSSALTQEQLDARIDKLIAGMSMEERVAQLQDRAPALPRLGIPAYNWWNEGLHGIARNGFATVFPQAIGLAATWDPSLLQAVGAAVSTEARANFNPHRTQDSPRYAGLTIWSPNINIFRDPRWGRGQETYGEDPFLTATLGSAFVHGIQGDDPFYLRADATPKHFVAHSGPEEGRDSFNAVVSAHDLEDTYLPAFRALTTTAHAAAVMCSYNGINGVPSCANQLLQRTLRQAWGFTGYVVSDCDAVGNLTGYQHYTADPAHGAAAALNAGTDLDCGNSYLALKDSLSQGLTTPAAIDRALHRLLLAKAHLGLLDPLGCTPYDRIPPSQDDTPAHRALALRAAEESIVLLHNDGTLPLRSSQRIAVIGPNADSLQILEANYHGTASQPVTELTGLAQAFPHLTYAQGSLLTAATPLPVPRTALRTSAAADSAPGLRAEYFSTPDFTGTPLTLTVPTLNFDIDRAPATPLLKTPLFSARWSGQLLPPAPGDYVLSVAIKRCWDCSTHDRFRLFLDGKLVLDNDGGKSAPDHLTLHAADTRPRAIRLELIHSSPDEAISLAWQPPANALLDQALRAATRADVIVAIVGLSPDLEGEALSLHIDGFNGGDRTSLDLPLAQQTLLHRLQALHKKLVIVLNSGSAVALDPADYSANALLTAWYPGEEGGHALANILTGKTTPSGRLPITVYRSVNDLPNFSDYSMAGRTYRYFSGPMLYPFGFGLSYTSLHYGPVTLDRSTLSPAQTLTATVTVSNPGPTPAAEVTELYLVPPALPGAPHLALRAAQRVELPAHGSRTLTFRLAPDQLSFVDPAGARSVRPGTYRLFLGGSQPTAAQLATPTAATGFRITAEPAATF